jgi:ribosomal-protein-alanine N-acetyltransferase
MASIKREIDGASNQRNNFRAMKVDDIEAILEVEHASFSLPWSYQAFYNEITSNHFANYLVLEIDGQIAGYCGVWVVMDEAHVTNIALLPQYRGQGYGEQMLGTIMELSKALGAKTLTLEVRVSNEVAQKLYRKLGFKSGGIRKKYYTDNQEDAIVMWVTLK